MSATVSLGIYDDRVEITNPGCFTHGLTPANIKQSHDSFPYNHTIAQVLFLSTYLENWGTGVNRMVDLCRKQGLPEPEYQSDGYTVKIIFWKSAQKTNDGNGTVDTPVNVGVNEQSVLKMILNDSNVTAKQVANAINITQRQAERIFSSLTKKGLIARIGSDKTGYWKVIEKQ